MTVALHRCAPARRFSLLACLAAMLTLGACAATPSPQTTLAPPVPYPPSARERMLRIAEAEWRDWGGITVDLRTPRASRPSRGPGPESNLENFPRVLAYWRAVEDGGAIARNRRLYGMALGGAPAALWGEPAWSAAFISYVLRNAGVDQREFPGSAAHAFYIDGMLADAAAFPATAPFIPHDWDSYPPQVGDLVCADRSDRHLAHWQLRRAETGQFRPMHCDIVVQAGPGEVAAIGGNIADAVTLSRFAADASGRLLPRQPGGAQWFAVFENRLGRLPPWGGAPARISSSGWRPAS
ncbi:hypothetical protein BKE38_20395 [Pseudoroseomonas deserti]|uniref:DUF2272 domain-containing protein n=1 Tax=Teichococcus deserti TaxID=1817963 RepID=A0A1V2GXT2_9PROT|nr:DUF2272 domain-containing protein [Pseudoroseomonas deserti]ONG49722.1 hypothetical protein BKE38_20395 [Pseudoroseomonas deserti]